MSIALVPLAALAAVAIIAAIRRGRASKPAPGRTARAPASAGIYQTAPADIVVSPFVRVGAAELAWLESRRGGGAILSYAGALAAARAAGAELATREDMIALSDAARAAGAKLTPAEVTLPDDELRAAGARPGDPAMRSEAWARLEDEKIGKAKAAGRWDPGAIKAWVAGAAPGRARLMGLRKPSGTWGQDGTTDPHDDAWSDYLTRTIIRRALPVA